MPHPLKPALAFLLSLLATPSFAFVIGAAPAGETPRVAHDIIVEEHGDATCAMVIESERLPDGSIRAICDNGEIFRVFSVEGIGGVAMRCSTLVELGMEGC